MCDSYFDDEDLPSKWEIFKYNAKMVIGVLLFGIIVALFGYMIDPHRRHESETKKLFSEYIKGSNPELIGK